jgi:drug/metabolite transporter (DMT)-like permease
VTPSTGSGAGHSASPRAIDVVALVTAAFAFAVSAPIAKTIRTIDPVLVASGRTLFASIALGLFVGPRAIHVVTTATRRLRLLLLLAGALLGMHFALFLAGLANTSIPAAVTLVALEPIAVVLVAYFAFRIRPNRLEMWGLALGVVGALLLAQGAGSGEHRLFGDGLVLGAVLLYGGYVACARAMRDAVPTLPYACIVYAGAALVLLPVGLFRQHAFGMPSAGDVVRVLLLAMIPTLLGHTLVQAAARRLSPSLVALASPGETVGSIAIAIVVFGQIPSPIEGVGAVVVLLGALVAMGARSS